jgi:hypothetical protein
MQVRVDNVMFINASCPINAIAAHSFEAYLYIIVFYGDNMVLILLNNQRTYLDWSAAFSYCHMADVTVRSG